MDAIDLQLLAIISKGISLTKEPFEEIALEIGIAQQEVINRLSRLKQQGIIRKFGVSIKPNNIGLSANALVAWKVPKERIQQIGEYLSKLPDITHCYERKPISGRWEFNLYTVMHAHERESINRKVSEISEELEISEFKLLFSTRDLKNLNGIKSKLPANSEDLSNTSRETEHF